MVKYICEKCGKEFTQKGHYTKHINKKNPCVYESQNSEISEKSDDKYDTNKSEQIIMPDIKHAKKVREEGLDKFYTLPIYSKKCIDKVFDFYSGFKWDLIIEPSAGNGSFLNQIPTENNIIGMDISPENSNIIKKDFFEYYPPTNMKNILVLGNPPFGKVSSLAIKFFNHAAEWAFVIAFIIPRTFRRVSVQNKLNDYFHLVYDEEIQNKPCCFSPPMMVKCCFQIWEKKTIKRELIHLSTKHSDWVFLSFGPIDNNGQPTPPNGADFAMRAYGGKIGEIKLNDLHELRPKSWHWIKSNIEKNELISRFNKLDYSNSLNTARQNSMGRGELVSLYTEFINSIL